MAEVSEKQAAAQQPTVEDAEQAPADGVDAAGSMAEADEQDDQNDEAAADGYEQDEDEEQDNARGDEPSVEPQSEEEEYVEEEVGPLVVSEAHETFWMDKKYEDDPTLGLPNSKHLLCQLCEVVIIPEMFAVKVKNDVDLIKNSLREYDICDTYWHVDSLTRFQNVEVHQLDDKLKYLCCLSCNCCILGY